MRSPAFLAVLAISAAVAGAASAQSTISVPIDQSIRLPLPAEVKKAFVGNDAIADVWVLDSQSLLLTGKAFGATNVMAMDGYGRTIFRAELVVSSPEAGRVSVYRGAGSRTDMACAPGCQVSMRSGGGGGGGGGGSAGASGGASTLGGALASVAGVGAKP